LLHNGKFVNCKFQLATIPNASALLRRASWKMLSYCFKTDHQ
jgi:hypothetical protein